MVESESQIACPACGATLPPSQLDFHLLHAHRTYAFRGQVRSIPETLAVLLAAVVAPEPDVEAWRAFETVAAHECGSGVDAFLAASLIESLKRLPMETRHRALPSVAALIAEHGMHPGQIVELLVAGTDATGRRLAWSLAERVPTLLTRAILESLLSGFSTRQAVETLHSLAQREGVNPAVRELLAERERNVRMRCTRCGAELRRAEMIQHLWTMHGLVLDNRRTRDPWEVIDEWIAHYRRRRDDKLLERCRELGEHCDPQHGLIRVYRRFLAGGLHHPEAQAYLLAEAIEHRAALCPSCFAVVPVPEQAPPAAVSLAHGRLSAGGYRIEVCESGIFPILEITRPGAAVSRQPLPGSRLTPRGTILLFVGPLVLAALLMALLPLPLGVPPIVAALTFVLPAVAFAVWIRISGRPEASASDRAVSRAWSKLTPTLHSDGFSLADSTFVAGLALASIGRVGAEGRARWLERVLSITEKAINSHPNILHHLAALRALTIADAVETGGNPVTLTAEQVGRCFDGRLALTYADTLLTHWRREWRTRANLSRLRVLLLDRAFEAGFEVRDLLAVGQTAPELGRVLGTDDPGELARLRLLWSLRPRRPWDRCGDAETVFGLAASGGGGQVLAKHPDLLLYRAGAVNPARKQAADQLEIVVSGRGVSIDSKLFSEPVATIEVRRGDTEHVLMVGDERFTLTGEPDEAATEIERWLRYYFHEFVPLVAEVYRWRSPHAAAILRAWGTVTCPECHAPFVARPGEIGSAVEDNLPSDRPLSARRE
jgi:hypothetical protein